MAECAADRGRPRDFADGRKATVVTEDLSSQRLAYADGRDTPVPKAMWRHWARLPGDEHLFTRDAGVTLEQGRVDWATLTVVASRPRPDLHAYLEPFDQAGGPTFTPVAGGILVHQPIPMTGALHLAAP